MVQFTSQEAEKNAAMFVASMKGIRSLEALLANVRNMHDALTDALKALDFAQQVIIEKREEIDRLQQELKELRKPQS